MKRGKNLQTNNIYILSFSSLDSSIATVEIKISAQRNTTEIKGLVFIFDLV